MEVLVEVADGNRERYRVLTGGTCFRPAASVCRAAISSA